jgi:hypothetical protein
MISIGGIQIQKIKAQIFKWVGLWSSFLKEIIGKGS